MRILPVLFSHEDPAWLEFLEANWRGRQTGYNVPPELQRHVRTSALVTWQYMYWSDREDAPNPLPVEEIKPYEEGAEEVMDHYAEPIPRRDVFLSIQSSDKLDTAMRRPDLGADLTAALVEVVEWMRKDSSRVFVLTKDVLADPSKTRDTYLHENLVD